jgi:hypothetical protein
MPLDALPRSPSLPLSARLTKGLAAQHRQDLADVLPYLACGEESAVYAFTGRLQSALPTDAALVLQRIANDEQGHANLIAAIQAELPAAQASISPLRLAHFFRRIEAATPAEHLARVAALDWAVCKLLQPLLCTGGPVSQAPLLHSAMCDLRQDEARHVRLARSLAQQMGFSATQQAALNLDMQQRLQRLVQPVQAALQRLGGH